MAESKPKTVKAVQAEVRFPTEWQFRIIIMSEKYAACSAACKDVILRHDPGADFEDGGKSKSGTYCTLRARAVVFDREDLNDVSNGICKIDGVKLLL